MIKTLCVGARTVVYVCSVYCEWAQILFNQGSLLYAPPTFGTVWVYPQFGTTCAFIASIVWGGKEGVKK